MLSTNFLSALKKITTHAQNFSSTLLDFDFKYLLGGLSELKILVSVVRFRPGPPILSAQLFSVGRFHLGHPQSTRGAAQFYVCQPPPVLGAVLTPKSHIPPSLLTKLLQTLTLWHTQNAFQGNNLRVCRIRRFCYRLAEANHEVCVLSHTTL
jgi:hypothetical protein